MEHDIHIPSVEIKEAGIVKEIVQGIVKAGGLPSCLYGQIVEFSDDIKGVVLGFNADEVLIIVLGDYHKIKVGDTFTSRNELLSVSVGEQCMGRVLDCLAQPIDGKGAIPSSIRYPVFRQAPGVMKRQVIDEPLYTGVKILDLVIPIGKGQRQLIIGDRQTGRSSLALDIILNQKNKDIICIYCFIGGAQSSFQKIMHKLAERDAFDYSIVIAALASHSPAEQFICPFAAASLGEYFMDRGKDVLIVFDDLTKHAWAYRQISLLLERVPGREAYPGDIFYIHSQLMERAGRLSEQLGSGTMSFFPIAETLLGDVTGYIPSNLIAMTDGQVYLNTNLFHEGFKPAIDIGLSVSRIGARVQPLAFRKLSEGLRFEYLQYRETLRLMKLRTRLSSEAQEVVRRGEVLERLFVQENYHPVSFVDEVALFYAFSRKVLEVLAPQVISEFVREFPAFLSQYYPDIPRKIMEEKDLSADIKQTLDKAVVDYFRKVKH